MTTGNSTKSHEVVLERGPGAVVAGRYRLVNVIGSGGMGSVWLAHDLSLDARCAVKLIDDDKAGSEEVRTRFAREAKAAAQLRGAHVVDVFDRGEWNGTLFIAMEYLDGEDLHTRLDRVGRLDPATTYRVVAHVARALVSAHAIGIVHRDLKPENVFLVPSYDGEVAKVLDFGIAQHEAYSIENRATRTGSFLGTPFYVSPEQARGKPTDFRSDLWSLAVIAFQCLTGRPPFESEALGELMGLILYEPLPKPTEINPELPAALDTWWARAASRDREQRFQSARELADELGRALGVTAAFSIPTTNPRRSSSYPSFNDSSGVIIPPMPDVPKDLAAGGALGSSSAIIERAESFPDQQRETGAPVTRTRRSLFPLPSRLVARVELLFARLERLRLGKLSWYAIGIPVGVVLVALIVFGVLSLSRAWESQPQGIEPGAQPSATNLADQPGTTVLDMDDTVGTADKASSAEIRDLETLPVAPSAPDSGVSESSDAESKSNRSTAPGSRSPPASRRPAPRGARPQGIPDYGI